MVALIGWLLAILVGVPFIAGLGIGVWVGRKI
jgi:hypothetical protein